jgi:hypothetical protein
MKDLEWGGKILGTIGYAALDSIAVKLFAPATVPPCAIGVTESCNPIVSNHTIKSGLASI